MSRVLITGGAGFIGSHVAAYYSRGGHETWVLDDFSSGTAERVPEGVHLIHGDVADATITDTLLEVRPDIVIHAAAQISVLRSMLDPDRDRAVNLVGTRNVLRGAEGAQRFVFISSGGAIYGEVDGAVESDPPHPASYYGVHKWTAEQYVQLSGLPFVVARLANVYGPGQRTELEGGVVAIFCERASAGLTLDIFGNGQQVRDFIHVLDVVRAIVALAADDRTGTWNVSTGEATTVNELADIVERVSGQALLRNYVAARPGDLVHSVIRADRMANDFGWDAAIDLEDGVRRLLQL